MNVPGLCSLLLVCMRTELSEVLSQDPISVSGSHPGYCASTVHLLRLCVAGTVPQTFYTFDDLDILKKTGEESCRMSHYWGFPVFLFLLGCCSLGLGEEH